MDVKYGKAEVNLVGEVGLAQVPWLNFPGVQLGSGPDEYIKGWNISSVQAKKTLDARRELPWPQNLTMSKFAMSAADNMEFDTLWLPVLKAGEGAMGGIIIAPTAEAAKVAYLTAVTQRLQAGMGSSTTEVEKKADIATQKEVLKSVDGIFKEGASDAVREIVLPLWPEKLTRALRLAWLSPTFRAVLRSIRDRCPWPLVSEGKLIAAKITPSMEQTVFIISPQICPSGSPSLEMGIEGVDMFPDVLSLRIPMLRDDRNVVYYSGIINSEGARVTGDVLAIPAKRDRGYYTQGEFVSAPFAIGVMHEVTHVYIRMTKFSGKLTMMRSKNYRYSNQLLSSFTMDAYNKLSDAEKMKFARNLRRAALFPDAQEQLATIGSVQDVDFLNADSTLTSLACENTYRQELGMHLRRVYPVDVTVEGKDEPTDVYKLDKQTPFWHKIDRKFFEDTTKLPWSRVVLQMNGGAPDTGQKTDKGGKLRNRDPVKPAYAAGSWTGG